VEDAARGAAALLGTTWAALRDRASQLAAAQQLHKALERWRGLSAPTLFCAEVAFAAHAAAAVVHALRRWGCGHCVRAVGVLAGTVVGTAAGSLDAAPTVAGSVDDACAAAPTATAPVSQRVIAVLETRRPVRTHNVATSLTTALAHAESVLVALEPLDGFRWPLFAADDYDDAATVCLQRHGQVLVLCEGTRPPAWAVRDEAACLAQRAHSATCGGNMRDAAPVEASACLAPRAATAAAHSSWPAPARSVAAHSASRGRPQADTLLPPHLFVRHGRALARGALALAVDWADWRAVQAVDACWHATAADTGARLRRVRH
jgi:hypothetical protein